MLFVENHGGQTRFCQWFVMVILGILSMVVTLHASANSANSANMMMGMHYGGFSGATPSLLPSTQSQRLSMRTVTRDEMMGRWQSYFSGIVGQALTQSISHHLNQHGQAQVDVIFDKGFGLRGRIDWLAPLYEDQARLLFSQLGLGREKNSVQVSLGLGQRHFYERWMLGYHAFLDADTKHRYWRSGLGTEVLHDYLKIGAQFYLPLSGWRYVPEFYSEARPARGYEIRATAYLPFYPKLGAQIKYEHYVGSQVGWFEENKIKDNPSGWTLGVRYTPIPLITLAFDRRIGGGVLNETRAFLRLNIDLNKPLNRQTEADAVKPVRLAHSKRYDIVERTHAIYLEYRPELLHAVLPATLIGDSRMDVGVDLQIRAKNSVMGVKWLGSAATACGLPSCVNNVNGRYMLTLPAYSTNGVNQYTLQAQVTDVQGNNATSNSMMVTVSPELIVIPPMMIQSSGDRALTVSVNAVPFMPVMVSGGTAPYVYSMGTPLPAGLTIDSATGAISGLPSAVTPVASYQVIVTDAVGASVSANFNLKIDPPPLVARSVQRNTTMIIGIPGQMFWPVRGVGGSPPYTLTISPALPAGLSKDADGKITGIPTVLSPKTTYTVTVVDSRGAVATQTFYLTILP